MIILVSFCDCEKDFLDTFPFGEQTESANIKTLRYSGTIRSFNPERDYLFPIPQQEILLLPNIEQNAGY